MRVSVLGLGKLGAPIAAVLAHKGHTVIGVDVDPAAAGAFNAGKARAPEPGLDDWIRNNRSRLWATTDCCEAVAGTEITFIAVPTPSEEDGSFSLRHVLQAAEAIGRALREKSGLHLVVLSSTVMPGSTGCGVLPALEWASGKRCGRDFGLCYNPAFVALGRVIPDLLCPDLVLIGESDERSGEWLAEFHRGICENDPPIVRMSFVNAELAKLAINTFVTTKITYANMLARICERLPGADVEVVTRAVGLDSRIGPEYLKAALGYGGPCFPRDNLALAALAGRSGVEAVLAEATDRLNRQQAPQVGDLLLSYLPEGGTAGILGLSYKPDTDVIEESQGLAIAQYLLARGARVVIYDPAAMDNARGLLAGKVTFARSLEQCVRQSHLLAITVPWDEFRGVAPEDLNHSRGRPTVVDCWRILEREKFDPVANYVTLGVGPRMTAVETPLLCAAAAGAELDQKGD
jgi:UDPglucose 6-dehydrogenase